MKHLSEIAFFTDRVESMAKFYQNLLDTNPAAVSDDMAIFVVGHTKIFIHKKYSPGESDLPPENHLAFAVEDVDSACQSLEQQGAHVEFEPRSYYWGRSAYLRDPDGHLIELGETAKNNG